MYAWGKMSPQMAQHVMKLFKEDLITYDSGDLDMGCVDAIYNIGSQGRWPGNCQRDMIKALPTHHMPALHMFEVPLKHNVLGKYSADIPMLLPHELFSSLYHNYKEAFAEYVFPSAQACTDFWEAVEGLAWGH